MLLRGLCLHDVFFCTMYMQCYTIADTTYMKCYDAASAYTTRFLQGGMILFSIGLTYGFTAIGDQVCAFCSNVYVLFARMCMCFLQQCVKAQVQRCVCAFCNNV